MCANAAIIALKELGQTIREAAGALWILENRAEKQQKRAELPSSQGSYKWSVGHAYTNW